mmetsp:Transcript_15063/g.35872  ORF Transcript_15063/g.35872 Transcript_15063/m.35872 type:complete len:206 (-) Transcript_15063:539-1156(-)
MVVERLQTYRALGHSQKLVDKALKQRPLLAGDLSGVHDDIELITQLLLGQISDERAEDVRRAPDDLPKGVGAVGRGIERHEKALRDIVSWDTPWNFSAPSSNIVILDGLNDTVHIGLELRQRRQVIADDATRIEALVIHLVEPLGSLKGCSNLILSPGGHEQIECELFLEIVVVILPRRRSQQDAAPPNTKKGTFQAVDQQPVAL